MKDLTVIVPEKEERKPDGKFVIAREANKTKDSSFERIYKFYFSKTRIELTAEEKKRLDRIEKAWLLLCRHRTTKQAGDILEKLFNVSRRTAFNDVRSAMDLFGAPQENVKEAKRAIAEHALLMGADKAWKQGQLELHAKYMKEYSEINGLKDNSPDDGLVQIIKNLRPTVVQLNFKMEDVRKEAQAIMQHLAQDVDFEE